MIAITIYMRLFGGESRLCIFFFPGVENFQGECMSKINNGRKINVYRKPLAICHSISFVINRFLSNFK